ncbi:lytic murein transglycosylase [Thermodesulfobacteriota bacterium]
MAKKPILLLTTLNYAFILTLIFVLCFHGRLSAQDSLGNFKPLKQMLVKDGFDVNRIESVYARSGVNFDIETLSRYFSHREATLNYDQFASRRAIKKARKYIQKYQIDLEKTEKEFGVDKEVITAIMLVETQLGTVTGNRSVLNSLSTFASLSDKGIRNRVWADLSNPENDSRKNFDKWADRKSRWAYAELKAFLTYTEKEHVDPSMVNGSIAGALGIAQFMPSNILAYAKDGNNDGSIDLFNHSDAIASIASYLKHYGWRPGIDRDKAFKVVYKYNHSEYYVRTILKIRERLKS